MYAEWNSFQGTSGPFSNSTSMRCGRGERIRVESDRQSQGTDKDGLLNPEMDESHVCNNYLCKKIGIKK